MSLLRSALAQSAWLFGARVVGAVAQAVMLALLARGISPGALGVLVATMGVLAFSSGLAELGLSPYALRAHAQSGVVPSSVAKVNSLSTGILVIASGLIIWTSTIWTSQTEKELYSLLPLAIWASAEKNSRLWTSIMVAQQRSQRSAVIHASHRVVSLLLFLLFVATVADATLAYTAALALAAVLANRAMRHSARTVVDVGRREGSIREVLKSSYPFLINTIGMQIRNLDVALVGLAAGAASSGLYALPARLISPLRMVPSAMAPVILRMSAQRDLKHLNAVRRLVRITLTVSSCCLGLFALSAQYLVPTVFGADYAGSVRPLQVLCAGLIFAFAITLLTSLLQGLGRERVVGVVAVIANIVALVMTAVGAITYGALGAAAGLSLGYVVHSLTLIAIWRHTLHG